MSSRYEPLLSESARLPRVDTPGDESTLPTFGHDKTFASYKTIIHYSLPLVLSNSGGMIMQFIDRMFLAWLSPEAVGGAGTAGIVAICFVGLFAATTGFTVVFTAQYLGARRPERLGPAIWQGWYLSLAFGLACFAISFAADPIFAWMGHGEAVRAAEIDYFRIYMQGGVFFTAAAAVLGFFIGRGDNRPVMYIQLGAIAVNVVFDYAMIFGKWGFPARGVAGAAWATILSQVFVLAAGMALFWRPRFRHLYATLSGWRPEIPLCLRIIRYGAPNGLRVIVELLLWSVFLGLIGLLGDAELAVSNVAFTINSLAWQPMLGVAMAVSMLVGKAQGAGRPDLSRQAMRRGLWLTQAWQTCAALLFVAFPRFFLGLFFGDLPAGQSERLIELGSELLWFVAAYCLLDSCNVVFAQGLIGAGDSWWTSRMTLILTSATILGILLVHRLGLGLYAYWLVATLYIAACGITWVYRYRGNVWESMRVVETTVVE